MMELLRSPHLRLSYDPRTRIVWMVRSSRPYESVAEMRHAHAAIPGLLDDLGRRGRRLLVDTRLAPPRDDADFEAALKPIRVRITRDFDRVAVLTRTAIGQLQVQRQARESEQRFGVFGTEQEAVAYLTQ